MKIPKEEQFIHRALFHEKLTGLFENEAQPISQKKNTILALQDKASRKESGTNESDVFQLSETFKRERTRWPSLFYFQEFVTDWIREIVIRPSKLSIISSATLYLVAVAGTLQRREGDRWFRFMLNAKLPGYDTIYKETSWESFSYLTNFLEKPIYKDADKTDPFSVNGLPIKSTELWKTNHIDRSKQSFSILNTKKRLSQEGSKHIHFETLMHKNQYINDDNDANSFGSKKQKLIDLYKEKLFIYVRSPWHKHVRKDFVGVFSERPKKCAENGYTSEKHIKMCPIPPLPVGSSTHVKALQNNSLPLFHFAPIGLHKDCFTSPVLKCDSLILPWYRIDACNRANRTIFATHYENDSFEDQNKSNSQNEKHTFSTRSFSNSKDIWQKRKRNRLVLLQNRQLLKRAKKKTSCFSELGLHYPVQDKIWGLEYLFPFSTSRQRLYAQTDMIPFKLESAYLILQKNNSLHHNKNVDEQMYLKSSFGNKKPFVRKNNMFLGQNVYHFQKQLRKLFYMYGLYSPLNVFGGEESANSWGEKQGIKLSRKNHNLEHNSQMGDTSGAYISSASTERNIGKHLRKSFFEGRINSNNAIESIVSEDFDAASFYKKLIDDISEQLEAHIQNTESQPVSAKAITHKNGKNGTDSDIFDLKELQNRQNLHQSTSRKDKYMYANILNMFSKVKESTPSIVLPFFAESSQKNAQLWGLLENSCTQNVTNVFDKNNLVSTRFMSGYTFPDYTELEINSLYTKYVLPQLFVSCFVTFSHSYLLDQALLLPISITLPPLLPASFFHGLALFRNNCSEVSQTSRLTRLKSLSSSSSHHTIPKDSQLQCEYKRLSLNESKEVKDAFITLGRDFQDYLSRPKDSPPAIRISASLDDDDIFKREDDHKEKRDDDRATTFERLQKARRREHKFELAKKLRSFAYSNQFAFAGNSPTSNLEKREDDFAFSPKLALSDSLHAPSIVYKNRIDASHADKNADDITPTEKTWLSSRLGAEDMRSDRRHNFFGRKHLLTKRLIAQEQKEVQDQILKNSFVAPHRNIGGKKAQIVPTHVKNIDTLYTKDADEVSTSSRPDSVRAEAGVRPETDLSSWSLKHQKNKENSAISYRRLQRKARKGYIQLLGSPEFSAHQQIGIQDRTRKADRALRGKYIKSAYSHLRWQKKRFRSRMLGTPCKRHFIMPEITQNDWKRILQWQLKNYFFLEEKRLQPLLQENPEKRYKIRQLDVYLPWITVRSASHAPFQWPYTRLDDIEYAISAQNCNLPEYKSDLYWDSGKSASISQSIDSRQNGSRQSGYSPVKKLSDLWGYQSDKRQSTKKQNGIRLRVTSEPFLCEKYNAHSYLLIYRLLLAFACKHLFQYIYRVSLKRFLIHMVNTDSGLMLTSPEFREWLENAPPKSVYTPNKRFKDVTIREDNIPLLSEMVWYLRNSGRSRKASQGLLLIGPPASEKISLVQAIAGECSLPIVLQSMGALALTYEEPYEQLENAFSLARQNAPCVLFLDDLDAIGQSRRDVIRNDTGAPDLLLALDTYTREGKLSLANSREDFKTHPLQSLSTIGYKKTGQQWNTNNDKDKLLQNTDLSHEQSLQEFQTRRINLLLRLLTEMDGIVPLHGVVVVATSEQPALLDPALLRAGRFEGRIHLGLPDQERRIQLFQTQTQKLGHMQAIPWNYLGVRTTNMSAIDIASAINHSAIRAILDNTVHTIETLEHGLRCVMSFAGSALPKQISSPSRSHKNDPFHSSRLAFFQAGKAVVHYLLLDHPQLAFCSYSDAEFSSVPLFSGQHALRSKLQVRQAKPRKVKSPKIVTHRSRPVDTPSSEARFARTRVEFESRLVGFYAGKAAELLHLSSHSNFYNTKAKQSSFAESAKLITFSDMDNNISNGWEENSLSSSTNKKAFIDMRKTPAWLWQSHLGFSELLAASSFIHVMIDRWYLYSPKLLSYKTNRTIPNVFAQERKEQIEFDLHDRGMTNRPVHERSGQFTSDFQQETKRIQAASCQANVCQTLEMAQRPYGKWYRIYLPQIEEREQNEEWLPPDPIVHESLSLHNLAQKERVLWGYSIANMSYSNNSCKNVPQKGEQAVRKKVLSPQISKSQIGRQEMSFDELCAKQSKEKQIAALPKSRLVLVKLCDNSKPNKKAVIYKSINDLYLLQRDEQYQNLVLDSFYTAFQLCHENRELLDRFADHLIRFHILRSHEMENICQLFCKSS